VTEDLTGVMVTAGTTANGLGIVRGFGRRGIRVIYLDTVRGSIARYSRYVSQRLKCRGSSESGTELTGMLLDFGKQLTRKIMIIPVGDREVLTFSKHKKELEQFYYLPVPDHEIVLKLVNKRKFYRLLDELKVPHASTYFPENISELRSMGRKINFPYIIKPAYSLPFQESFHRKCFFINSARELDHASSRLKKKNFEVMIQEIIPGRDIYEFYTYFNKEAEPLAFCGWDKIRQYPPDFGSGSFCRSISRPDAMEEGIKVLKAIGYHGLAAPELKKDPRDGRYKLIEINARTTLQNRLAAACGLDIEYIAYLDAAGYPIKNSLEFPDNILWIDDFADLASCLILLKRKKLAAGEILRCMKYRKLHSVASWDDPVPLVARGINICIDIINILIQKRNTRRTRTF